MRKLIFMVVATFVATTLSAQINFETGTLKEAMAKAKSLDKKLFVDCYAVWCGPCKSMEAQAFSQEVVGKYFNEHFVCYKLDVDKPENKEYTKKYMITAMPTFLGLEADGKLIAKKMGGMSPADLIRFGQVVSGERNSFEENYSLWKKDEKNIAVMQELLLDAKSFVSDAPQEDQKKWMSRVNDIYSKYMENKPLEQMINPDDFVILATFNPTQLNVGDPTFEFIIKNYHAYTQVCGKDLSPQGYIISVHSKIMDNLVKKASADYLVQLDRINGDMKDIYGASNADQYKFKKLYLDALYVLYKDKNIPEFARLREDFFGVLGDNISSQNYAGAAVDLFSAYNGKIPVEGCAKCVEWLEKAITMTQNYQEQVRYHIMLSDSYLGMKNTTKAKDLLSTVYIQAAEKGDKRTQNMIKQKLDQIVSQE